MRTLLLLLVVTFGLSAFGQSKPRSSDGPDCGGPNHWAASMTFVHMKNAGLLDNDNVDFSKTAVVRIASQKLRRDLWRQVYDVRYTKKSGEVLEAIAVHDASREECSMSGLQLFVVSKRLGDPGETKGTSR